MADEPLDVAYGRSYELRIGYDIARDGWSIYLVALGPDKRVTHMGAPVVMVPVDRQSPKPHEPTIRAGFGLLEQFAAAIAKQTGIKPEPDAKLQGTLEATRAHLQDMRVLAGVVAGTYRKVE